MSRSLLVAASLLLASGLRAEVDPTAHLFPADKDGAPAPLAPLGEANPRLLEEPGRGPLHPVLRDKITQLKDAGITREDMQRIRAGLEQARDDESVKAARKKAEASHQKLRDALRAYAEAHGIEPPEPPVFEKDRNEGGKEKPAPSAEQLAEARARKKAAAEAAPKAKPEATPEQLAERRARKLEGANRKPDVASEKFAEIRKVMEGAKNDPAVKAAFEETRAAGEALREAVKAAMLKADPTLAPLLDKVGDLREAFREEHSGLGFQKQPFAQGERVSGGVDEKPRSPKMAAAFEAANADPAVKSARKAAEEAKAKLGEALKAYAESNGIPKPDKDDPEAMAAHRKAMEAARNDPAVRAAFEATRAAGEALREATRAAVLKADPSLASEFEKPASPKSPKGDKPAGAKKTGA